MTVGELIALLETLPRDARVVVPSHRAFRDADLVPLSLAAEGPGPGVHAPAGTADPRAVPAVAVCTRHRAAELREDLAGE